VMQSLKRFTAREGNRMLGLTGQPFWQDESYDRLVRNDTEFERMVHYIERNPVTDGLAGTPEEFPWSSARPIDNRPQVDNLPHISICPCPENVETPDHGAIARRVNCLVPLAGHLSLLLEAMQDVDGFLELGDVHHAVNTACLPDPDLPRARTYLGERLPVVRLKPGLDLPQLEARFLPGISWECQQIVVGRPYPTNLFFIVHTASMYKILYAPAGASQRGR